MNKIKTSVFSFWNSLLSGTDLINGKLHWHRLTTSLEWPFILKLILILNAKFIWWLRTDSVESMSPTRRDCLLENEINVPELNVNLNVFKSYSQVSYCVIDVFEIGIYFLTTYYFFALFFRCNHIFEILGHYMKTISCRW